MHLFKLLQQKTKPAQNTDQVGDGAKIDELVHLQII